MNIFKDLDKLKNKSFAILFGTLLLIASGIQAIFFFDYNLFINLDVFKLILLSITFGLGLVIIPFITIVAWVTASEDKELHKLSEMPIIYAVTAPFAYFLSSISLLISYLFGLSFKTYVIMIIILLVSIEMFIFLTNLYMNYSDKRKD